MSRAAEHHPALRRRLLLISGAVLTGLALLAVALMVSYSRKTADRSYDLMLGSAVLQMADAVRHGGQGFSVDIPVSAFATLAQAPEDRVFYRISINGEFLTGYRDLPAPPGKSPSRRPLTQERPDFYTADYAGEHIRVARLTRLNTERLPPDQITIELAQTRLARRQLSEEMMHPALELLLGLLASALLLLWLGIYYAFLPFRQLARALARRQPRDLTPLSLPVPRETLPLLDTINHFIARQHEILARMESYTSVAAHQLRTPLASLRALCENARDEADEDKRRRLLSGLIGQCDQLSLTVRHLLNQAVLDHRFHSRELVPVELNTLVKGVCLELAIQALHRRVALAFEPADAPQWIAGDEFALTQMLKNLIENAVAHSPPEAQVEIHVLSRAAPAIHILDRGPGLPEAEKARVFERFYRGAASRYAGSGLGMAIARDVAEHHGARILLHDHAPSGLDVEIRFQNKTK
ncbi:sensor histidine kinase [Zobellella endophytica]|uniref:histidine kinase n=1 Tax=Zobellella endophytica TaxID=2116700 RepID=A0A2P7QX92_9GAMM|nr:sensor histidine kinase [Zobellella endophytica]PSJ42586.1 sensor histidine kinase [Zobellella endophytica]